MIFDRPSLLSKGVSDGCSRGIDCLQACSSVALLDPTVLQIAHVDPHSAAQREMLSPPSSYSNEVNLGQIC